MNVVNVENLSHRYNSAKLWAVNDISFNIGYKGIVALLGSNGAGKSTTMNILCGVLNQTKGVVKINGVDIRQKPEEAKRHLGFLPQEPPLYPDLTVDEYLDHCARLRLMDKKSIPSAIEEVKDKVKITHFSKRLLKNLSGGYRQRVGIAQAIIHKPKLVVLDEPTVGLDPNQIVEVRNLVQDIATDRAVIFATHILSEVDYLCKDVLMIGGGKIIFSGTLDEFKAIETPEAVLVTMNAPPLAKEILDIEGVTRVEFINERKIRVSFSNTEKITQKMIRVAGQKKWELEEIVYEQKSLDAIFSKLSQKM